MSNDLEAGRSQTNYHYLNEPTHAKRQNSPRAPGVSVLGQSRAASTGGSPSNRQYLSAREAYAAGDVQASIRAHLVPPHTEMQFEGEHIKAIVFGGLDGISTMFAFLMGCLGAELSIEKVVALGIAQLVAGAMGMGMGEYLSAEADADVARKEMDREKWEVENNPQGEISEMVQIYINRGIEMTDAVEVANILSKYKDFWIEHMMLTEIGIIPNTTSTWEAIQGGIVMFFSFLILGAIPLIIFCMGYFLWDMSTMHEQMALVLVGSGVPLLILGAMRAKVASLNLFVGSVQMLCQGFISAGGAFALAYYVPLWFGFDDTKMSAPTEL